MTEAADRRRPEPYPQVTPAKKAPFLPNESFSIRRLGEAASSGLTIYVFRDVLEELIYAASFQPALTLTGILTGGFYEGPAGHYIEVRGFQDTAPVENTLQFAERLRREWRDLWHDRALQASGLLPLGWFVSRTGCGGKPGPFELITHLSFFNRPYHTFCVLDPLEQRLGFYRQVTDAELANVPFNLIELLDGSRAPGDEPVEPTSTDDPHSAPESTVDTPLLHETEEVKEPNDANQ